MTNLPISNNNFQSSPNSMPSGAPLSAPRPSEGRASGNADPTSNANSVANDQTTDNFSVLLARQIGETGMLPLDITQFPAAVHGKSTISDADPTLKDTQDKASIATSITIDPANSVTAILMQIPAQQTGTTSAPAVDATLLSADPSRLVPGRGVGGIKQAIEDNLQRTADKSIGADNALPTTNNRQQTDSPAFIPLSSDAVKHEELKVSIVGQPHTGQNITPEAHSVSVSAVMPNILNNDIRANTPQTISTPIDNSGWADEFSQKIVWMSTQQNQIAELNLNPPDLGPLNVVLKISDNQLTAQFTSPHSAVRDAVENAMPKLREMLADNNITLGNATVSDQAPRDRGAEGFMKQDSGTAAQHKASFNEIESDGVSPISSQSMPVRRHNGMLDIFA
jgi:flagellar hook-length control protein FliK